MEQCRWIWHKEDATKVGNQPHSIWQYVMGDFGEEWLKMTWNKTWKDQMNIISKCTEGEMMKSRKNRLLLDQVITPCSHELHKTSWEHHHCNACRKLPQNHIKYGSIWICNHSCNSTGVQGAECKIYTTCIWKGFKQLTIITMQFLGKNYPKSIYGMGNLEFEQTWQKFKND